MHTNEVNLATDRGMTSSRKMVIKNERNHYVHYDEKECQKQKIKSEAQLKLQLEELVEVNERYQTIYEGLKLNTAHNSSVTYPLSFFIRRITYATVIVFIPDQPQISIVILMAMSVGMLIYTSIEQQWKERAMNQLDLTNEALLYLLLVIILCNQSIPKFDRRGNSFFGWCIISIVILAIVLNLTVIMVQAWKHTKLLLIRKNNKKVW